MLAEKGTCERLVKCLDGYGLNVSVEPYHAVLNDLAHAVGEKLFRKSFQRVGIAQLVKIWNFLCENKFSRSDCLAALGGGVTGDMTGFAAATYLRGIDFVHRRLSDLFFPLRKLLRYILRIRTEAPCR